MRGLRISDCQRQVSILNSSIASICATRVEQAVAAVGRAKAARPMERAPTTMSRRTDRCFRRASLLGNTDAGATREAAGHRVGANLAATD